MPENRCKLCGGIEGHPNPRWDDFKTEFENPEDDICVDCDLWLNDDDDPASYMGLD